MTDHNNLQDLKKAAKWLARAKRIPLHKALDTIATVCGQPHWNALTKEYDDGWRPSPAHENEIALLVENDAEQQLPFGVQEVQKGEIDGHPYELIVDFDDVLIGGNCWAIHLGHAPSEPPAIEKYAACAIDDPAVLEAALAIAHRAANQVRLRISSDWPRRSTKPDAEGRVMHPLWAGGEPSSRWFCLHCDGQPTGTQMAENMWHCPNCNATPIDIFSSPFWKEAS